MVGHNTSEIELQADNAMNEDDEEGSIRIGDIYLPPPPPPACTFDSSGPRLIITHIENDFFKSYAGKQVIKLWLKFLNLLSYVNQWTAEKNSGFIDHNWNTMKHKGPDYVNFLGVQG